MKKLLFILTLVLFAGFAANAQDDDNDRIRDKMREFIQKRLNLSKNEAEKFTPVFIRYFREWRQNLREPDALMRQQKEAEVKIRYRIEFREIVGEKRSNEVYKQQRIFIDNLKKVREDQIKARRDNLPNKPTKNLLE
jgi:Holliday junction resolvase RusA-like endonuclease